MNFTSLGNHFASIQCSTGKSNTVQTNASTIFIPSTTSHYHHASFDTINYPNNNHIISSAIVPSPHHQDLRHFITQNNFSHSTNTTPPNWIDVGLARSQNDSIKTPITIPTYTIQASATNAIQWPLRTIMTQNVSTMTDLEKPENLCTNGDKKAAADNLKPEIEDNQQSFGNDNCSKIHLKNQKQVMAEYLARLQASSLPSTIQQFLQRHNIKTAEDNRIPMKKKSVINNQHKTRNIKMFTALDGSTLYCCPECHMAYVQKDLLEQHLAAHKAERKFECNVCGVCLKRKEHLDQHKRGHSEERPFVCGICCKGFKRNEHLRRHIVIHSGDKTHSCDVCGKAFSRKDHLNKHTLIHIAKRIKTEIDDNSTSSALQIETNNL